MTPLQIIILLKIVVFVDNGSLAVQATPLLARAIIESSQLVPNPSISEARQGQKTVFDTWLRTRPSPAQTQRPA